MFHVKQFMKKGEYIIMRKTEFLTKLDGNMEMELGTLYIYTTATSETYFGYTKEMNIKNIVDDLNARFNLEMSSNYVHPYFTLLYHDEWANEVCFSSYKDGYVFYVNAVRTDLEWDKVLECCEDREIYVHTMALPKAKKEFEGKDFKEFCNSVAFRLFNRFITTGKGLVPIISELKGKIIGFGTTVSSMFFDEVYANLAILKDYLDEELKTHVKCGMNFILRS